MPKAGCIETEQSEFRKLPQLDHADSEDFNGQKEGKLSNRAGKARGDNDDPQLVSTNLD